MIRKKYASKFKARVVLESLKERAGVAEMAQKFDLASQQIHLWKREFLSGSASVFKSKTKSRKTQAEGTEL